MSLLSLISFGQDGRESEFRMKKSGIITLVVGGVVGAALGVFAAFLIQRQMKQPDSKFKITPGQGLNVGKGLVALFRAIFDLGRVS